jgi:cytochrome c nitrite reductase small subunit
MLVKSLVVQRLLHFSGISVLGLLMAVMLGVALGAGGYTYSYGEGFSYFSSDPRACVNCHIMRDHYDGWQKSTHHAVATCNDCHTPHDFVGKYATKADNGFWHSYAFTLQNYRDPLIIRPRNSVVLQNSCVHCHHEMVDHILPEPDREDGGASSCVRCHGYVGHGPVK